MSDLTREQVEAFARGECPECPCRECASEAACKSQDEGAHAAVLAIALLAAWDARDKMGAAMVTAQTERDIAQGVASRLQGATPCDRAALEAERKALATERKVSAWLAEQATMGEWDEVACRPSDRRPPGYRPVILPDDDGLSMSERWLAAARAVVRP